MKQTLLLIFLGFISVSLSAQLGLNPEETNKSFDPKIDYDLKTDLDLSNLGSSSSSFIWNVEKVSGPDEWNIYVCDLVKCYGPGTMSIGPAGANSIASGDTKTMNFHLLSNDTYGKGTYILNLTSVNDPSNVLIKATLNFEASETVATEAEEIDQMNIFPNPVSDYFKLNSASGLASKIEIYDVLGKKIKSFEASSSSNFFVGDIASGRYFARIFDKNGKSLKVVRLVKR